MFLGFVDGKVIFFWSEISRTRLYPRTKESKFWLQSYFFLICHYDIVAEDIKISIDRIGLLLYHNDIKICE